MVNILQIVLYIIIFLLIVFLILKAMELLEYFSMPNKICKKCNEKMTPELTEKVSFLGLSFKKKYDFKCSVCGIEIAE